MKGKWKPKVSGKYYYIFMGRVIQTIYYGDSYSEEHFYFNNMFKSRKQAEAVLKKIKEGGGGWL